MKDEKLRVGEALILVEYKWCCIVIKTKEGSKMVAIDSQ
jgi:hypothetical protein